MRPVSAADSGSPMQASVAAALATILELDLDQVPVPGARDADAWTVWRDWLAQRGLGLLPVAEPASFHWPGPWLALLRSADGAEQIGAVAFGVPPGIAWHPFGGPETFDAIEAGYVVAPTDVALWTPGETVVPSGAGRVETVLLAGDAEAPMRRVESAVARAGRGLEGDRYYDRRGTFSARAGTGRDLTLIEGEVLDALTLPPGGLAPEEARRNVVTRGIDLNALVGRRFRIGDVECLGQRRCEPCAHLERLVEKPGTLRALVHKGGLRADVLTDGEVRVGSSVAATGSGRRP